MAEKQFSVAVSIRAVDQVSRTINQITGNVSRQGALLNSLGSKLVPSAQPRSLGNSLNTLGSEIKGVFGSIESKDFFKGVGESAHKATRSVELLGSAAKQSINVLLGTGLAMGGLGIASAKLFQDLSRSNLDLKHSSQELGVKPGLLRSYRYAAQSLGVEPKAMDSAFARLNQIAIQVQAGNPSAGKPLYDLGGIKTQDSHGKRRSGEDMFKDVADKLSAKGLTDQMRAELTRNLFGSTDLLPVFRGGSNGIENRAKQYDNVTDSDFNQTEKATAQYVDANTRLSASLNKLKLGAGSDILPGFSKGLDQISDWISAHGAELKDLFKDIGESIPREMGTALMFVKMFAHSLAFLSKHIGVMNIAMGVLGGSIALKLGMAIKTVGPVVLPVLGSILKNMWGLGKAIHFLNWRSVVGGLGKVVEVGTGVFEVLGSIPSVLMTVARAIPVLLGAIVSSPLTWIIGIVSAGVLIYKYRAKIKELGLQLGNALREGFQSAFKYVSEWVSSHTTSIGSTFSKMFSHSGGEVYGPHQPTEKTSSLLKHLHDLKIPPPSREKADVTVRFENLPKGARIEEPKGNATVNIFAGYSLAGEAT